MIIKTFLTGRHKFIVAKQTLKNKNADQIGNYRKYIEKSLILSLLIVLIFFQLFPKQKKHHGSSENFSVSLEVIDIPITKQEEPPPPPPPVQEMITNYSVIIKNEQNDVRKLREELEDVILDLDLESDNSLLSNSQIGDINYASLSHNRSRFDAGVSLDIGYSLNRLRNQDGGGLDFKPETNPVKTRFVDDAVDLNNPPLAPVVTPAKSEIKKSEADLIEINENQFLLKEAESTIGTNEYRLWNKINAALDRLDKNRYGKLPENLKRTQHGIVVTFAYKDGIIHEIFWSKGGKVIIRVTGSRPRQQVAELQKAFDSLIHLTL